MCTVVEWELLSYINSVLGASHPFEPHHWCTHSSILSEIEHHLVYLIIKEKKDKRNQNHFVLIHETDYNFQPMSKVCMRLRKQKFSHIIVKSTIGMRSRRAIWWYQTEIFHCKKFNLSLQKFYIVYECIWQIFLLLI